MEVRSHVALGRPADSFSVTPINHTRPPSGPCPPAQSLCQWEFPRRQSCRDDPCPVASFWNFFLSPSHFGGFSIHGVSVPATQTHMALMGKQHGNDMEEGVPNRRSIAPDKLDCDHILLRVKSSGQWVCVVT